MDNYIFHTDPGHGWLAVLLAELRKLEIQHLITPFSYLDQVKGLAYLEEDCDASTFIKAKFPDPEQARVFWTHQVTVINSDGSSFIRNLRPYIVAGKQWRDGYRDNGKYIPGEWLEAYPAVGTTIRPGDRVRAYPGPNKAAPIEVVTIKSIHKLKGGPEIPEVIVSSGMTAEGSYVIVLDDGGWILVKNVIEVVEALHA